MSAANKKLGKGLGAIFGREDLDNILDDINSERFSVGAKEISMDLIFPNPYQPRKTFEADKLEELSNSIKQNGLISPILIKKSSETGKFYIVAGERRYRASKLAGLKSIAAIEVDYSDEQMQEIALIENIQRVDLSTIEEARAYQAVLEKASITQEQLASRLNKSRTYVTNILRLLTLPVEVVDMISEGKLEASSARTLIGIEKTKATKLAEQIVAQKLNTRQAEELAKEIKGTKIGKPTGGKKSSPDNDYSEIAKLLEEKVNSRVSIKDNKVIIEFRNEEQLMKIFEKLDLEFE